MLRELIILLVASGIFVVIGALRGYNLSQDVVILLAVSAILVVLGAVMVFRKDKLDELGFHFRKMMRPQYYKKHNLNHWRDEYKSDYDRALKSMVDTIGTIGGMLSLILGMSGLLLCFLYIVTRT